MRRYCNLYSLYYFAKSCYRCAPPPLVTLLVFYSVPWQRHNKFEDIDFLETKIYCTYFLCLFRTPCMGINRIRLSGVTCMAFLQHNHSPIYTGFRCLRDDASAFAVFTSVKVKMMSITESYENRFAGICMTCREMSFLVPAAESTHASRLVTTDDDSGLAMQYCSMVPKK